MHWFSSIVTVFRSVYCPPFTLSHKHHPPAVLTEGNLSLDDLEPVGESSFVLFLCYWRKINARNINYMAPLNFLPMP